VRDENMATGISTDRTVRTVHGGDGLDSSGSWLAMNEIQRLCEQSMQAARNGDLEAAEDLLREAIALRLYQDSVREDRVVDMQQYRGERCYG
jgi:hypothetical protein